MSEIKCTEKPFWESNFHPITMFRHYERSINRSVRNQTNREKYKQLKDN